MGQPAAKQGDQVTAMDTHIVVPPPPATPTPVPLPFNGILNSALSQNVKIMKMPAATEGSKAQNTPPHIAPPPTTFANPPSNQATIQTGSATVKINGKAAARAGDTALTCNDPTDLPVGTVVATGTVLIG